MTFVHPVFDHYGGRGDGPFDHNRKRRPFDYHRRRGRHPLYNYGGRRSPVDNYRRLDINSKAKLNSSRTSIR